MEYKISEDVQLQLGYDMKRLRADYNYLYRDEIYAYYLGPGGVYAVLLGIDTIQVQLAPRGNNFGVYLSGKFKLEEPLILECGGRYDHISYTGDKHFSNRWNLLYNINERSNLHAGVGDFYQSQRIYDIPVGEGETEFYKAEKVRHYFAGYQHKFENGMVMGLEGYHKKYSDLRPEYRNIYNDIETFPEYEDDRCLIFRENRKARGMEIYILQNLKDKLSWRASYALSKVDDSIASYVFLNDDEDMYRNISLPAPNDQRHTVYLDINYKPDSKWQVSASFQYHTGRPYTDSRLIVTTDINGNNYFDIQPAELMGRRFKDYHRLDIRASRNYIIGKGKLTAYFEVLNVYGRENIRVYEYDIIYDVTSGQYILAPDPEKWFTIMPMIGIIYELNF